MNYYQILNVDKNSSIEEVKKVYATYSNKYMATIPTKEETDTFKKIFEAYYFLSEKERSMKYQEFYQNNQLESMSFKIWKSKEWSKLKDSKETSKLEIALHLIAEIVSSIGH